MEGDWIALDWMIPDFEDKDLELALLIDPSTEAIMSNSRLESSVDSKHWVSLTYMGSGRRLMTRHWCSTR